MSLMLITPEKYTRYPVFSYKEVYRLIDRFETIIETVAGAKDPQTTFTDSQISVKDVLGVMDIVTEELSWSMNRKLNAIWYAEESELYPSNKTLEKKQHGNPYAKEIGKLAPREHQIEMFEKAIKWVRGNERRLKAIKEDINEK